MSQQVPADPFLNFMERFRFIMVRRLQGIVPNDLILKFVDKIIWHALRENEQDYSYIVLRAVFKSMGISQEQKHRLIQHAGWANTMSFQHGNAVPPHSPLFATIRGMQGKKPLVGLPGSRIPRGPALFSKRTCNNETWDVSLIPSHI